MTKEKNQFLSDKIESLVVEHEPRSARIFLSFLYYEMIKRDLNRILMYECRCDERLKDTMLCDLLSFKFIWSNLLDYTTYYGEHVLIQRSVGSRPCRTEMIPPNHCQSHRPDDPLAPNHTSDSVPIDVHPISIFAYQNAPSIYPNTTVAP